MIQIIEILSQTFGPDCTFEKLPWVPPSVFFCLAVAEHGVKTHARFNSLLSFQQPKLLNRSQSTSVQSPIIAR